ncbi:CAP domain-containing protein [Ornithinibacillus bavariensis]|uniref:SCP domain-containing protein n=1 Tax=Ornithinibacillus bavariensis TaxID=545502 RepID=A0A920C5A4_9BACI|nr:CAP domain-containing protein [Ornithinibacillus bavariensis]GIO26606.1 hypothetical protein J43TS3_12170 [Ornithinibacillus bavariensis]
MKKNYLRILFSIVLIAALSACGTNNNDNANQDSQNNHNNQDNRDNTNQNNDNISSLSTDQSSDNYPHTQPIQTQEAKYKFQEIPNGQAPSPNTGTNNLEKQEQPQNQPAKQQQSNQNYSLSNFESDVVTLTNKERAQAGVPELQIDQSLSQVAREKSNDMQRKGYFSHTSPTYGSPFDMMRDFGITYKAAGENIAQGQTTPADVVNAWMNSEGHRENILNPNFTHIGVGYDPDGQHWTQMFIQK